MNLLIKKVSFFITTGIFLSLMACNSESYTDAQKPIRNLGGTSLKTQKEVGAELKAEMLERKKKIEARRQARLAELKAGGAQPAAPQTAPEPAVTKQAQPAPAPAPTAPAE